MYFVRDEASEAVLTITDELSEAIDFTANKRGKYIVEDDFGNIVYDSCPEVSYKF